MSSTSRASRTRRSSASKGQWFLISTVVAVGALLSVSLVMKDFFAVDASTTSRSREGFYEWDLKEQFENIVNQSSCADMQKNLDDFISFSRARLWESGYLVYIEYQQTAGKTKPYSYICNDSPKVRDIGKGILIATQDAVYYDNIDPSLIIR